MYVTASYLLSVYAKKSFYEFAKERIFDPLGMKSTVMSPTEAKQSGYLSHSWAQPTGEEKYGRRIPFWFSDKTHRAISGAGGVISSAEDMVGTMEQHFGGSLLIPLSFVF